MQTGSSIKLGGYKWRVLDIQNGKALLLTEYIIEQRAYHDTYESITYADCSLRGYLNGEFYDKFTPADQSRIIPGANKNPDNQWYGSAGGADTEDRIFLLSVEEAVCKYFGDSSAVLQNPGNQKYKYWFNKKDENNSKRIACFEGAEWSSWWWLRSPGRSGRAAVYIHGDPGGNVGMNGNNITSSGGLRPALWLEL